MDVVTAADLTEVLVDGFYSEEVTEALALDVSSVRSFEDAGVLTSNDGLVLRLSDGREFQLTVVQSR